MKSKIRSWTEQVKKGIITFFIIVVVSIVISAFIPMIRNLLNSEKEEVTYNHETEKQITENNVDIESETSISPLEHLQTRKTQSFSWISWQR